jgi:integration host factor subunit alpha
MLIYDEDQLPFELDITGETLTKADLAALLSAHVGLNKRESKDMVDAFFDTIRQRLIAGEDVKLTNFGNFVLQDKPARPGRNPKTGESYAISARRVVVFHPCQALKEALRHDSHVLQRESQ